MIVKPTVNELLNHAENRFALVIATSKRAREISKGDKPLTDVKEESSVTLAANEINEGKVTITSKQDSVEEVIKNTNNMEEDEE